MDDRTDKVFFSLIKEALSSNPQSSNPLSRGKPYSTDPLEQHVLMP